MLDVTPTAALLADQNRLVAMLAWQGATTLTGTGDRYFPHPTPGNLRPGSRPDFTAWPAEDLWNTGHAFQLALGRSDEQGVYRQTLFSLTP